MAQELIDRVEILESNDRATLETLKDLTEGQRHLDFKVDEIIADVKDLQRDVSGLKTDVKDLKTDVSGLKTDVKDLKTDVRTVLQRLDRIDRHLGV